MIIMNLIQQIPKIAKIIKIIVKYKLIANKTMNKKIKQRSWSNLLINLIKIIKIRVMLTKNNKNMIKK